MGVCATKHKTPTMTSTRSTPVILDSSNLRTVVLNVTVQASKNPNNDGQAAAVKTILSEHFPAAVFQTVPVTNTVDRHFNLICDGKLLHSSEFDGNIQNRRDQILQELNIMAKNKLASQF